MRNFFSHVSMRRGAPTLVFLILLLFPGSTFLARAQYQGPIAKDTNTTPTLRATAVYEWTGDLTESKAARLVPIAVWDGQQYQPGGLYLAQPEPLTVETGTLYELEKAGTPQGTFQITRAVKLAGSWIGLGFVKPQLAAAKPKPPMSKYPPQVVREVSSSQQNQEQAKSNSGNPPPDTAPKKDDSDRPTLHRHDTSGNGSGPAEQSPSNQDPDRPTLHKRSDKDSATVNTSASVTATNYADADRPKLRYGKPDVPEGMVEPSQLEGFPPDMEQMAAISDVKQGGPHPYIHSWYDPADEARIKAAVEKLAQQALADENPAAKYVTASGTKKAGRKTVPAAAPLPELIDEKFNAFELSWSGGVTIVFSAKAAGENHQMQYITLIAQPDFYGQPQIIFKQITRDDRLDVVPRMRLVDAVDTDNDNRAELLFELRGTEGREFGIYRVANRSVEQVFHTGPQL
jgi:hypothetical protein